MSRIRLYQIPFSHFCDKVRWALDYFRLEYETSNFSRKDAKELRRVPRSVARLLPLIEDENVTPTKFLSDSTPILLHLDENYAQPDLFLFPRGDDEGEKAKVVAYCLMLDSELGLYTRRLAYLHLIVECPHLLAVLIDGQYHRPPSRSWSNRVRGFFASLIIIERFRLDRLVVDEVEEKTVALLDRLNDDFRDKEFLFSSRFTAADLTFVSLLRPLSLSPSFVQRYASLFAKADRLRAQFDPSDTQMKLVERAIDEHRRNPPGRVDRLLARLSSSLVSLLFFPFRSLIDRAGATELEFPSSNGVEATNDQRTIKLKSVRAMVKLVAVNSFHYFVTLPKELAELEKRCQSIG